MAARQVLTWFVGRPCRGGSQTARPPSTDQAGLARRLPARPQTRSGRLGFLFIDPA